MRTTLVRRIRAGAVAIVAALTPIAVTAQQPAAARPTTYTVKRGDTLWDLAKRFLNDSYLWPRIYRLNTALIRDPHWIYPGEVLTLPGAQEQAPTIAQRPAPARDTTAVKDTTVAKDTAAVAEAAPAPEPPVELTGPTVFTQHKRSLASRIRASQAPMVQPPPVVRLGEFLAAPYVEGRGRRRGEGKILGSAEIEGISSAAEPTRYQPFSKIFIMPPAGASSEVGDQYVVVTTGPNLEGLGRVVIPTGIVRVTRAPQPGVAAVAEVERMFNEVRPGQQLLPYDSSVTQLTGAPQAVQGGRLAKVQWVYNDPVLPALQSYLVVNLSSRDGVKVGDRFELYRPGHRAEVTGEPSRPEIPIAHASVVRVTPFGTTVVLTGEEQPKIAAGTNVRVTAQMP